MLAAIDNAAIKQQQLHELGKQIYLHGILPDGDTIHARVRDDVSLSGSQYACANCHRRSGIGASEGGDLIPPVVGSSLFAPRVAGLNERYTAEGMYNVTRPAYTTRTLGKALREGIDPAGRQLSPLMPRFALSDEAILALSTYLGSLTVTLPPGIDDKQIHFATIATPGNESKRSAMLEVFSTFFRDKNARTRNELRRAQHAPFHKEWMYEAYRQWTLHVWELSGPEQSWPAQLQRYYQEQPVFALLGGVGSGDWQAVHRFCEQTELPCLLPNIGLPPAQADRDFYSVYFSRGVELEAMAVWKALSTAGPGAKRVLQVLRDNAEAHAAADLLRNALKGNTSVTVTDRLLPEGKAVTADFWSALAREHGDSVWVLWLDARDLEELERLAADAPPAIYLSATLGVDIGALQQNPLRQRFILLSPHLPPGHEENTLRFRTWARLRNIPISDLHLQSASFLAVTLAGESLMHMRGNLSREYFLERIEHMMDNMINPSLYPRLSLAPGQRFAAKGCYVWEMGKAFDTAKWIVP